MSDHPSAEQLSRLIDADLPLTERAAVLDHLATCPTCAGSHARLVEAAAALRELPAVAWRPEVAAAISAHATAAPAWRRRSVSPPAALIALAIALVLAVVAALPLALLSARVAAAESHERTHEVMAAAARLPVPLCRAVLLRDLQGLAYEEIAQLEDVPIGTVRSRIAEGRARLAEELGR